MPVLVSRQVSLDPETRDPSRLEAGEIDQAGVERARLAVADEQAPAWLQHGMARVDYCGVRLLGIGTEAEEAVRDD
jgi:hypothetical protein